ncbi:MAG: polar amino acid transport system substrate-binding protein [Paraglaciecola sp.]
MKLNNRLLQLCWVGCCLFFSNTTFARSFDDIIASQEIVVAVYRDFVPFSFQINGEDQGIDVDIARHIAAKLGVKLRIRWMTADENVADDLRNNLWKGHYLQRTVADLMLRVPYDKAYSQLRDDIGELVHGQVHMFAPYHVESWQIIYDRAAIESVPTIAVFQYHNRGVQHDSIPQFYLMSAFGGRMKEKSKQFVSIPLAVSAMVDKKVDAVMGMRSQVSHYQGQLDAKKYPLAENAFPMIGKQKWDLGMAVKKDYRQLAYATGDIVKEMIANGTMKNIFDRYQVIYEKPDYYSP